MSVEDNGSHDTMTPEELEAHNIEELTKGIMDLVIHNESRIALLRDDSNPWIQFQFEMLSFKLDIVVDALVRASAGAPELRMAEYGMDFQLRVSKLLDTLFPTTAAQPVGTTEG